MTEGNAILVVGLLIVAVAVFLAGLHFRRPLVWMASLAMWVVCAVVAYTQSVTEWDSMFFLFFVSVGFSLAAALMTMQSRQMDDEEVAGTGIDKDLGFSDRAADLREQKQHNKDVSDATGGTVASRRRGNRG